MTGLLSLVKMEINTGVNKEKISPINKHLLIKDEFYIQMNLVNHFSKDIDESINHFMNMYSLIHRFYDCHNGSDSDKKSDTLVLISLLQKKFIIKTFNFIKLDSSSKHLLNLLAKFKDFVLSN